MFTRFSAQQRNPWIYLALLLGGSFALVVYSYWLVDLFPPTSRPIIVLTALAGLAGAAGYYLILRLTSGAFQSGLTNASRWVLIVGSVLIGVYLAFAYLNGEGSSARYINFLLPRQTLRIQVPTAANAADTQVAITRFSTSLGDVSYDSLSYGGWSRSGTDLVLANASSNQLDWTGRTGEQAVLTFRTANEPRTANISWNGRAQTVNIPAGGDGRYQASFQFEVPFYCSQAFLLFLGAIDFIVASCAVNALIWKNRTRILAGLERSVEALFHPQGSQDSGGAKAGQPGIALGQGEWVLIAGLIAFALLLRVFNLGVLYPYADEYSHLLAAKALLQGASLTSVFDRSLLITTVPVVISQRLFGMELWSARLPGAIFNALAIFPLYLLARKINKPVAVLSCLLYATSPWIIGVARTVREYAYYPFYFYWIVYAMVLLLERLPGRLVLFKDWRILLMPDLRALVLTLLLVPVYAVFIDARSTFKSIAIAYGVFALFLLGKLDMKSRLNRASLALFGTGILVAGVAYAGLGHLAVPIYPHFDAEVLGFFLPSPPQQWYFDRPALVAASALVVAGLLCIKTLRANFVASFVAALLLASAVFFVFFFGHYLRPRYLMIVQFWYVPVLALGLYGIFALQRLIPRREVAMPLVATALVACTFNVSQSLLPTFYDKQGNMPITDEYHFNIGPAYTYLLDKVKSQDVLLSSFYGGYVRWKGVPEFKEVIPYQFIIPSLKYWWIFPYEAAETLSIEPHDFILSVVHDNNSGWIVLDSVTYSATLSRPLALKDTKAGDKQIDYVGYFGGEYIWKWHPLQPAP